MTTVMFLDTPGTLPHLASPYKGEESADGSLGKKLRGAGFTHAKPRGVKI
jgi:hypothetical protein